MPRKKVKKEPKDGDESFNPKNANQKTRKSKNSPKPMKTEEKSPKSKRSKSKTENSKDSKKPKHVAEQPEPESATLKSVYINKVQKEKIVGIIQNEIDKEITAEMAQMEADDKQLQKVLYSLESLKIMCLSSRYGMDENAYPIQQAIEARNLRFPGFTKDDLICVKNGDNQPTVANFSDFKPKRVCCGCDMDSKLRTGVESDQKEKNQIQQKYPDNNKYSDNPNNTHHRHPNSMNSPPKSPKQRPSQYILEKKKVNFIVGSASRNFIDKNELCVFVLPHNECSVKPQDAMDKVKFELELENGQLCSPFEQTSPNDFLMTSTLNLPPGQAYPVPPKFCRITMFFKLPSHNKAALCRVPLTIDYSIAPGSKIEGPRNIVETELVFRNQVNPGKRPRFLNNHGRGHPPGHFQGGRYPPSGNRYPVNRHTPGSNFDPELGENARNASIPRQDSNFSSNPASNQNVYPNSENSSYAEDSYDGNSLNNCPLQEFRFEDELVKCKMNFPQKSDLLAKSSSLTKYHKASFELYKRLPPDEFNENTLIEIMNSIFPLVWNRNIPTGSKLDIASIQAPSRDRYLQWAPAKRAAHLYLQGKIFFRTLQYHYGVSPYALNENTGSPKLRNIVNYIKILNNVT